MPEFPGEHFTVVAARGGDDVWAEIRRRRIRTTTGCPMSCSGPPARRRGAASRAFDARAGSEPDAAVDCRDVPDAD